MRNPSSEAQQQPAARAPRKRRPKTAKPEMLTRTGEILSFSATVRTSAVHRRGEEPEIESQPWLELRGRLHQPVKGVTDLKVSVYPQEPLTVGSARPASVGSIIGVKPELQAVLPWSNAEFDRLWALALSGHLKFTHLYFTSPHYRSALVVSASFSNELEE